MGWEFAWRFAVFGRNDNPPKAESPRYFKYGDMTLYGLRIYEKKQGAHACVREYVPAEKGGVKGLYETMNGTFHPATAAGFTFEGSATNTICTASSASDAATYRRSGLMLILR